MTRFCVIALAFAVCFAPLQAFAEDQKDPGMPPVASDEEAAEALAVFKVNYKARGLKGDDRLMQRDFALQQIAPIQHPDVVRAIGKVSRSSDGDLRLLALIYLADQKAHPHLAAKYVLDSMRRNKKDIVLVMTGLQTLGELKYLGAKKELGALLKHNYFVIRKTAITTVGDTGDLRLLSDVLELLGLKTEGKDGGDPDKESSSGAEQAEEGYSWEGASAEVDRGEADNTQENADAKKQAEEKIAANKAAAEAKAGKGGGAPGSVPGGSSSGGGGRGAQGRNPKELEPIILRALKKLTGEEFDKPSSIRKWLKANKAMIKERQKALDAAEKKQKAG